MSIKPLINENSTNIIIPDWPAAKQIHAFCTTRDSPDRRNRSAVSNTLSKPGVYDYFNLALHVDDDPVKVKANRTQLVKQFNLPHEPVWLDQVHGRAIVDVANVQTIEDRNAPKVTLKADASFSTQAKQICAVLTADCLPVLICNKQGTKVAAAHAGWRGLGKGVIEAAISALNEKPEDILIWFGPAIGADAFEVGEDVHEYFVQQHAEDNIAFKQNRSGHYLADLVQLARLRLQRMGVKAIYGDQHCTYTEANRFYSYRRDGKTGRQVSLIWIE